MANRISNLGPSGMDIDATVKSLMTARRVPYDKMFQNKTLAEWKKASYNTMYNTISDFRTTVFNNKLQATLAPKQATSSDEAVATVSAKADAANIGHDLVVTTLASGVKKTSDGAITASGNSKSSLASQFGLTENFSISIKNGSTTQTIPVDITKSINELVSSINNAGVDVSANYDATLDRFFLSTKTTGATASLDFTGSDANAKLFLKNNLKLGDPAEVVTGKDAAFTLDNVALTQSTNNFTISGVSYSLKSTSTSTVKVAVSSDIDTTVANVKKFVESYNAMLSKVNTAADETRYKDFLPLSDAQKAEMKEADITAWDLKAKSGMLRNDPTLRSLVDGVRSNVSTPVSGISGSYTTASSIGISTLDYSEGGKLYLDENKLRTALTADPEAVSKLFGATGSTSSAQGIAVRMYDTLKTAMDKIVTEAGITAGVSGDTKSSLAKQINTYTTDMYNLNNRLADIEDRYYKQFDAMEVALTKLQNQSSWLSQQLGTSG